MIQQLFETFFSSSLIAWGYSSRCLVVGAHLMRQRSNFSTVSAFSRMFSRTDAPTELQSCPSVGLTLRLSLQSTPSVGLSFPTERPVRFVHWNLFFSLLFSRTERPTESSVSDFGSTDASTVSSVALLSRTDAPTEDSVDTFSRTDRPTECPVKVLLLLYLQSMCSVGLSVRLILQSWNSVGLRSSVLTSVDSFSRTERPTDRPENFFS